VPRKKRAVVNKAGSKRTSALDASNGVSPLKMPQGEGEGDAVLSPGIPQ